MSPVVYRPLGKPVTPNPAPVSGQDPDAWCDLSKFDLPEEPSAEGSLVGSPGQSQAWQQQPAPPRPAAAAAPSVTEYRLDGHTISDLSRSSRGELIPISPSTDVGGLGVGTPPSMLKRQKKRRVALSPVTENSASLSFLDSCNSLTPKSTPVKTLPFSPSQVRAPHPDCSLGADDGPLLPSTGHFLGVCCVQRPCAQCWGHGTPNQVWPCPREA